MAFGTDLAWNSSASAFSLTSMVLPASGAMVQHLLDRAIIERRVTVGLIGCVLLLRGIGFQQ